MHGGWHACSGAGRGPWRLRGVSVCLRTLWEEEEEEEEEEWCEESGEGMAK